MRMGGELSGRTHDRAAVRPPEAALSHFRHERQKLPLPRVDESEEGKEQPVRGKQAAGAPRACHNPVGPDSTRKWVRIGGGLPANSASRGKIVVWEVARRRH